MPSETRWFEPCRFADNVRIFLGYGMIRKNQVTKCKDCPFFNDGGKCKKAGKPIRATITYEIKVGE